MRIIIVDRAKFKRVGRQIANNQPVELATFLISSEVEWHQKKKKKRKRVEERKNSSHAEISPSQIN